MARTTKVLVGILVMIILLPVLLLVIGLLAPITAHAAWGHKDHHGLYRCDTKTWQRYLGIEPYPQMMAGMRIKAHACIGTKKWVHRKPHHRTRGHVIRHKSSINARYEINGWGESIGLAIWNHDKYRTVGASNGFNDSLGVWAQQHTCQTIGIRLCTPSGNFVSIFQFWSPYIVHHSDGSIKVWDFRFHEGEPGKDPDGPDRVIRIAKHD